MKKIYYYVEQYLFVVNQISSKDSKHRFSEMKIGRFWKILDPLIYMIVLSTYYSKIIVHDIDNFPVFVFIGIIVMNYYRNSTTGAMGTLVKNKQLLVKTKIPISIFIYEKIFSAFKELLFSSCALGLVMLFFKIKITARFFTVIPILILTTVIIIGVSKTLSVLSVFFGDIDYLYSLFMTMIFFVSGIFVPVDHMPEKYWPILTSNPIFLSIYMTRNSLMYNLPSHYSAWIKLIIWAIVTAIIGNIVYIKNKNIVISKL
ncbi:ABC transporter permease [Pseudobutyrivibrio sp. LB2011]|uniref:ABC transporter permease n=1 Tax=Pseudobutyrivibrio sp. LB2011 TaxID=1408312 RepID=UPI0005D2891F|nr:ABC transporter permease [Pseudobutyrivibrio sp. LB2011]